MLYKHHAMAILCCLLTFLTLHTTSAQTGSQETFHQDYPAYNPFRGVDLEVLADGYELTLKDDTFSDPRFQQIRTDFSGEFVEADDVVEIQGLNNFGFTSSIRLSDGTFMANYTYHNADGTIALDYTDQLDLPEEENFSLDNKPLFDERPDGRVALVTSYLQDSENTIYGDRYILYAIFNPTTQTIEEQNTFFWADNTPSLGVRQVEVGPNGTTFVHNFQASLIAAHFVSKLDANGNELWRTQVSTLERPPVDLVPTKDGGVWVWNNFFNTVAKYDADGAFVVSLDIFGLQNLIIGEFFVTGIALTPEGGLAVVANASPQGVSQLGTAIFAADGSLLEYELYPDYAPFIDVAQGFATPDGGYAFVGEQDGEVPLLVKTDNMGAINSTTGGDGVDLNISLSGSDENPAIYTYHTVTVTLVNEGTEAASDIVVSVPKAVVDVFQGGDEYVASQGLYKPYSSQQWYVGTLAAGETATLQLNYFRIGTGEFFQYAEVLTLNENDVDSTPGNGNGVSANEDDEAVYPGDSSIDPCAMDTTVPQFENCPQDIEVTTMAAPVQVFFNTPFATDNCSEVDLLSDYAPNDFFNEGTTQVVYVAIDASGNEANCVFNVTVNVEQTPSEDCDYTQPVASDFPWHEWLSKVNLNNQVEWTSGKSPYSDFTEVAPIAEFQRGFDQGFVFEVTFSYSTYDTYFRYYVDFNQNGIFEEDEYGAVTKAAIAPGNNVTAIRGATLHIPEDALLGDTRARIIASRFPITDACSDIAFGEIEDYTIRIVDQAPEPTIAGFGAEQQQQSSVSAFPNPASDELNISFDKDQIVEEVQVIDTHGQVKWSGNVDPSWDVKDDQRIQINTSGWMSGVYFVQIKGPYKTKTISVLIQQKY